MQYIRLGLYTVLAFFALLAAAPADAFAKAIQLNWSQNSESDVTGYRVRYGTSSGSYTQTVNVGNLRTYRLNNVTNGQSYYFVVIAYNSSGLDSNPSSETRVDVPNSPTPTPTPDPRLGDNDGDGTPDDLDGDDDNDGLTDVDELARGTNPLRADTDLDGVSDAQEVLNGTNPLDPGSGEPTLGTTICSEWNGYLGGMWNIAEMVNMSNRTLTAVVTLYNQAGAALSQQPHAILPGQQRDALVHGMAGYTLNAYGNICITHDGAIGDMDGRMVYYKEASAASRKLGEQYDFAFAMPFSNGKAGRQYVFFDTFQRSGDKTDVRDLVANWIQVTNVTTTPAAGVLRAYDLNGGFLGQTPIFLGAGQRMDVGAHKYGSNQLGMVEWVPDRDDVRFQLRNVHYLYDNAGSVNSFATGFQQEGAYPSGDDLIIPVTTENLRSVYLQVSNTSDTAKPTTVHLFGSNGAERFAPIPILVRAKGSWALQLDAYMPNMSGFAVVKGGAGNAFLAGAVELARNKRKAIAYMYLVPGKATNGTVIRGSYNTYLGQGSVIRLMNASMLTQTISVDAVRSDGTAAMAPTAYVLTPYTTKVIPLADANAYGVVTVQGHANNTLVSWVDRMRPDFVIPTPVRE